MKKVIGISLVFLLFLSSLGIKCVVNYCPMMSNYSISLEDHKTCCCGDSKENSCCKSQKISVNKIEDRYIASAFNFKMIQFDFINNSITSFAFIPDNIYPPKVKFYNNLRPPKIPVSLNILFRTFLI